MKVEGDDAAATGIVLILLAAFCAAVLIASAIYAISSIGISATPTPGTLT